MYSQRECSKNKAFCSTVSKSMTFEEIFELCRWQSQHAQFSLTTQWCTKHQSPRKKTAKKFKAMQWIHLHCNTAASILTIILLLPAPCIYLFLSTFIIYFTLIHLLIHFNYAYPLLGQSTITKAFTHVNSVDYTTIKLSKYYVENHLYIE